MAPAGAIAYWAVDDVGAAHTRLLALGALPLEAQIERGPGYVTASVIDAFGNAHGVMQNAHYHDVLAALAGAAAAPCVMCAARRAGLDRLSAGRSPGLEPRLGRAVSGFPQVGGLSSARTAARRAEGDPCRSSTSSWQSCSSSPSWPACAGA